MDAEKLNRIDLLSLDVEGRALDVLVGLRERIRDVSVFVGEVHEKLVDESKFYRFLDQHGSRIC